MQWVVIRKEQSVKEKSSPVMKIFLLQIITILLKKFCNFTNKKQIVIRIFYATGFYSFVIEAFSYVWNK